MTAQQSSDQLDLRNLIETIPALVLCALPDGSVEFVNRAWQEYTGGPPQPASAWSWQGSIHPDDFAQFVDEWNTALTLGKSLETEARIRRADGQYRWFLIRKALAVAQTGGGERSLHTLIACENIHDRKQAQEAAGRSEKELRDLIENIPAMVFIALPGPSNVFVSRGWREYTGLSAEDTAGSGWQNATHPDDLQRHMEKWRMCSATGEPFEDEARFRRAADGVYRWFLVRAVPLRDNYKNILKWYGVLTDIEERKRAEETLQEQASDLQRSEAYLLEGQRLAHTGSWSYDVASGKLTTSPERDRIFGIQPNEDSSSMEFYFNNRIHPDDRKRARELFERCVAQKTEYREDYRIVLPDGTTKHLRGTRHPILNDAGELVEIFGTTVDMTEQVQARTELEKAFSEIKLLKDQLYRENLALREEVDQASMFEEIVGTSGALQAVLDRIAKVAPTDSTVLIMGETGTGKELIARAVHKRSRRSGRAFVSVNCAALAPSLIASELFGHEKGAFTGATQRRLGRFELADGGTIFLDEVGELPPDTQIALLRVLQEREFERVGGAQPIKVDVRVIAATNRDLRAATSSGTFRLDLFYRLNVFPIDVPPLRQRKDDILVLLEYFVKRFASRAGKDIRTINKKTLELFQAYEWPGNIRELQNVIERSVIVSSGDVFSVDESWLSKEPSQPASRVLAFPHVEDEQMGEREIIEAALAETRGRVSGPSGAAAKLGMPRSTLESRIKALKIGKRRFKFG